MFGKEDGHVLRRALEFEVDGEIKKWRPTQTWRKHDQEERMKVGMSSKNAFY